MATGRGGSYYLTYRRDATRRQIESCYPQFAEFLRLKKKYDSEERFQSDWYRNYKKMFADSTWSRVAPRRGVSGGTLTIWNSALTL